VFENLTSLNGDEKDEREGSRAGRRPPILKEIEASIFVMPIGQQEIENRNRLSPI
jgi:hypothetical protein